MTAAPEAAADAEEHLPVPPLATRTLEAAGTVVSVVAPMDPDELGAAVQAVGRVFTETLARAAPPEGLERPWALATAGEALIELGLPHWGVNADGDVLCSGSPAPGQPDPGDGAYGSPFYGAPWRVGVTDPDDPSRLLADVPLAGTPGFTGALATVARGAPPAALDRAAPPAAPAGTPGLRQVTVAGPGVLDAHRLAARILAGAPVPGDAPVLAVGLDGRVLASAAWPRSGRAAGPIVG